MNAAIVINPTSGHGTARKRWPDIKKALLEEGFIFEFSFTEGPNHATELTRRYLQEGFNLIIAVGGDGTVNEVVNGFFSDKQAVNPEAALGIITTGTGCDLKRSIATPADFKEAARKIKISQARLVDLGLVRFAGINGNQQERYFINITGLGLDGDTVARVNRTNKVFGGFASFLWGTVISLLLYRNLKMKICVDDQQICYEAVTLIVVSNGSFFGGGMKIAPDAKMDDGFFDIIIIKNMSKLALFYNLPRVYRGTHTNHPLITSLRGKKVAVASTGKALINLDGEQPGNDPVLIELAPLALKLKG